MVLNKKNLDKSILHFLLDREVGWLKMENREDVVFAKRTRPSCYVKRNP